MIRRWIKSRVDERTSWNGAVLIGVGLVILNRIRRLDYLEERRLIW